MTLPSPEIRCFGTKKLPQPFGGDKPCPGCRDCAPDAKSGHLSAYPTYEDDE